MDITVTKIEHNDAGQGEITIWIDAEGLLKDFPIMIPVAALDTRKAIYNLKNDESALESILREHGLDLYPMIHNLNITSDPDPTCEYLDWKKETKQRKLEPQGDLALDHFGGLHDEIEIAYANGVVSQRKQVLNMAANRSKLSQEDRTKLRDKALTLAEKTLENK